ncbi:RAB11-binding protein RELCH homolog [Linum perenne]
MMDVERSSLCNCVVNFLLEENYLLTAFELLHELLDDGRDHHAIRLKEFFSDPSNFPPDQISRLNSLRVADPQSLLEENEATREKLALSEYELRLAHEDISKLKSDLQKKVDLTPTQLIESKPDASGSPASDPLRRKQDGSSYDLGPLKENERRDLNCAVKEYLRLAGYRLTAMTFYEEVTDQNLDVWQNTPASVPDALRHYYYQYLSSTSQAAEEKVAMIREKESLLKVRETLNEEKERLLKGKELADNQLSGLTKSFEALQKDIKDKENQIRRLNQSLEHQRMELNDCRSEITSLKMHIEGYRSGRNTMATDAHIAESQSHEKYKEEIKLLHLEIDKLKAKCITFSESVEGATGKDSSQPEEKVLEIDEEKSIISHPADAEVVNKDVQPLSEDMSKPAGTLQDMPGNYDGSANTVDESRRIVEQNGEVSSPAPDLSVKSDNPGCEGLLENTVIFTSFLYMQQELLPLMMCAIERHPDKNTRTSLTHTLFNLIKRPDEQQRQIIMDACVSLAKNVGQTRTEEELLPECWEQVHHMYEERRLLVAQSCRQIAEFLRPEIRDSLILSIVQQLIDDPATVVRDGAAHNLALLLPQFPNMDKYFKVEELMFILVCDPSGVVVETTLRELLPAVIKWGNNLEHILEVLLSHILSSAQRCPPLSGVEGSLESHLRVLGERERWNLDVLLRMLVELLPLIQKKAFETCPFSPVLESNDSTFSDPLLEQYAGGHVEWPAFEWMHLECFPDLIHLSCLLHQKEDSLRNRITKFLLAVGQNFGDSYLAHIMLPVFLVAVGDDADFTFFPSAIQSRIKGLKPKTSVTTRLATTCVLPLLLAGVLGSPNKREQLEDYLRKLLVDNYLKESQPVRRYADVIDAVRFLCTFEQYHNMIFNILWEMVVSSSADMKIHAANLLKVIVPYVDTKIASSHVVPALVTLGSDQNLNVKYVSIESFGAVAQHFKNDLIVDKIRVQMDAFLEDGSHEATIAVVRALSIAVPHTTERLRDYILNFIHLLSKIFNFSGVPPSPSDVIRRRERANAFCEAIRALDATDLSVNSVKEYLLPAIQNMLKDPDALDPAHKEAIEIIMKERSGRSLESIGKVMGAHLGIASSVSSFFGESKLLGKKETAELSPHQSQPPSPKATLIPPPQPAEDTRFLRIMRGNFTDMLRKSKNPDEAAH